MTGRDPYYVRKGWVDEDGHIRVIQSSLKIMHRVDDVYGDDTTDEDVMTDVYTYPAPSEDANENLYTAGYSYLDEMVDLVESVPPSPVEETTPSSLTAGESAEDGELGSLATVTASKLDLHFQPPSLAAQSTYTVNQISNIYTQSLPYSTLPHHEQGRYAPSTRSTAPRPQISIRHDLASTYGSFAPGNLSSSLPTTPHVTAPPVVPHIGFAPLVPNMASLPTNGLQNAAPPVPPNTGYAPLLPNTTHPYRPINTPVTWSGYPILSLPNGSRVGQPIPPDLHPIINAIRGLRIIGNTGHPERRILKKPYEGTYETASRDGQLIRDHFAGGSGLLKSDSPMREWYGDLSVFSAKMWQFLMVQKARVNLNAEG